jgi:hypothetical protein
MAFLRPADRQRADRRNSIPTVLEPYVNPAGCLGEHRGPDDPHSIDFAEFFLCSGEKWEHAGHNHGDRSQPRHPTKV